MERRDVLMDETWDLSCRSKQGANLEREVLDLSRKNLVAPTTTYEVTNTTACLLSENLPANKQHQQSNLSEPLKSPFARIVMLSPSSEIDSLRKPTERCEPFFYNANSEIRNAPYIQRLFHQTSSIMGTPLLRPVPLHLNDAMKVPVTITTSMATSSTSPSIPYAETSIQHQTNDRTTEGTLEFMNGPLTQVEMSTPPSSLMKKSPRPFKAYSKNSFPVLKRQIDIMSGSNYLQFRENVLKYRKMHESAPNPKMRRTSKSPALPTSTADEKNAAYLEKRKKNNEAAKRSRDNRRAKEDELAIWATFLEDDNTKLRNELAAAYCLMQERGIDLSQIKKN